MSTKGPWPTKPPARPAEFDENPAVGRQKDSEARWTKKNNEVQATLVVLGTRGKSGLREMLIGTTAEKIVQNAPCSILAVKPDGFIAAAD